MWLAARIIFTAAIAFQCTGCDEEPDPIMTGIVVSPDREHVIWIATRNMGINTWPVMISVTKFGERPTFKYTDLTSWSCRGLSVFWQDDRVVVLYDYFFGNFRSEGLQDDVAIEVINRSLSRAYGISEERSLEVNCAG